MKHYSRLLVTIALAASILLGMHPATDTALCAALPPSVSTLPAITAEISTPVRFATDPAGYIYVTDPHSGGILKYNNALSTVQHIPTSKNGSGVAIAQNGDILVTQGTYVAVLDKATFSESSRFGTFSYANGIAVDASGNIYVTDGINNNIQKFGVAYNSLLTSSIALSRPAGIRYEKASDRLVVASSLSGKIMFVKPLDLTLDATIGTGGAVGTYGYNTTPSVGIAPKFIYPQGIAFEYDGGGALYRIYVSDSFQNVVQVLDGTVPAKTWLANIGGGGIGFDQSKLYQLYNPSDVLFDDQPSAFNKRILVANGGGNVAVFGCDNMQPSNIQVINPALSSLTVTWANPLTSGFSKVRIYSADAAGNPLSLLTDTLTPADTSFNVTGLSQGTTYYYLVRAVDTLNKEYSNTQPVSATTRKNYTLTVTAVPLTTAIGTGSGSINGGASSGVDSTNSVPILDNTLVTLTATPNALTSIFNGWTDDCAVYGDNPTCQVTMTAAKNVTAKFRPQYPFYVDGYWLDTLQDAHWAADGNGSVIEAMAGVWPASSINNPNTLPMTADRLITTTIKGGFDSEFTSPTTGTTVVKGRVNLRSGKTIFNNIKIRP